MGVSSRIFIGFLVSALWSLTACNPAEAPLTPLSQFAVRTVIMHPQADKIAEFQNLNPVSCSEALKILSQPGDGVDLHIENATNQELTLIWIDYTGRPVEEQQLASGAQTQRRTFTDHPWQINNSQGQCQGIYVPLQAGLAKLTITQTQNVSSEKREPNANQIVERVKQGASCLRRKNRSRDALIVERLLRLYEQHQQNWSDSTAVEGFLRPSFRLLEERQC